jgi:hypothetical protein
MFGRSCRRLIQDRDVNKRTRNRQRAYQCNSGLIGSTFTLNGVNVSCLHVSMTAIVRRRHTHAVALSLHVTAAATFCRRHSSTRNRAEHRRREQRYESRHCCDDPIKAIHLVLGYLNKRPEACG